MFYRKSYRLSAADTEGRRAYLAEIKRQIGDLEQERESLSGADKARITRTLTPLYEVAEGLERDIKVAGTPVPLEPAQAVANINKWIEQNFRRGERITEKLQEMAANPDMREVYDFVGQWAEDVAVANMEQLLVRELTRAQDNEPFLTPLHAMLYALRYVKDRWVSDLTHSISFSTNPVRNALEIYERNAKNSHWDHMRLTLLEHYLETYIDQVAAWYELHPDEAEKVAAAYRNLVLWEGKRGNHYRPNLDRKVWSDANNPELAAAKLLVANGEDSYATKAWVEEGSLVTFSQEESDRIKHEIEQKINKTGKEA